MDAGFGGVSILILLDAFLLVKKGEYNVPEPPRFNPCFTGCFSFSASQFAVVSDEMLVSILILLDAFLLVKGSRFLRLTCCVSILILLDAFLLVFGEKVPYGAYLASFNPYFTGCFSFSWCLSVPGESW